MKKLYTLLALLAIPLANAQIINFPDPNFKSVLLYASDIHPIVTNLDDEYFSPDANNDGEIDVSEAANIKTLDFFVFGTDITDFTGIEHFVNLEGMDCSFGLATTINLSTLTHFQYLVADGSSLTSLDFSNCAGLLTVYCPNSQLTELNLSGVTQLETLDVSNNHLTSLEVHAYSTVGTLGNGLELLASGNQLSSLTVDGYFAHIDCYNNLLTDIDLSHCTGSPTCIFTENPVVSMNLKNGGHEMAPFGGWPLTATYICVDEGAEMTDIMEQYFNNNITDIEINSFCSVTPGGEYFTMQGSTHIDANANGCDASDPTYPHLNLQVTDEFSQQSVHHANASGNYALWLPEGDYTVVPQIVNPTYFTVSPSSVTLNLGSQTEPILQDFCITPNGAHTDLSVALIPLEQARPGFDVRYKIVYQNVGSAAISGYVTLVYDDAVIDPVSSVPTVGVQQPGTMTWSFSDLAPFESRSIVPVLNLNAPTDTPALNGGDVLHLTATGSIIADENLTDNTSELSQVLVNSLDPNDKTCLEGDSILPEMAGEYVHYLIRFENTGDAEAVNVFVKDVIDTDKFDLASLVTLAGSHPYTTRIDGSTVKFVFENINLPFDDANNDGYVLFIIKTNPNLVFGDTFSNTANIYFDYNHPIVTNTATTALDLLQTRDFEFSDYFAVYPNPVKNSLSISSKTQTDLTSLEVYNTLGQLVLAVPHANGIKAIDVASLESGHYFLKVVTGKGISTTKFIKQ